MSCVNREAIGNPVTKKPGSITLEEITASPENGSNPVMAVLWAPKSQQIVINHRSVGILIGSHGMGIIPKTIFSFLFWETWGCLESI